MNKIKDFIFSEIGMRIINTILWLVMIFKSSVLGFIGSILWVLYLVRSIQTTNSMPWRIAYILVCIVVLLLVFLNMLAFVGTLLA